MSDDARGKFLQEYVWIKAPPELVFRIAESPEEAWRWVPGFVSAKVVGGGEKRVGSDMEVKMKVFGRTMTVIQHLVSYDPPRSVGFTGKVPMMAFDEIFRVAGDRDGAFAGYDIYVKYLGPMKLLGNKADSITRFVMRNELRKLKSAAEAYPNAPPGMSRPV